MNVFDFVSEPDSDDMKDVRAPRFIEPLRPKIVAEGEVVIMEARVESFPTCSFQWFQHSIPIKVKFSTYPQRLKEFLRSNIAYYHTSVARFRNLVSFNRD